MATNRDRSRSPPRGRNQFAGKEYGYKCSKKYVSYFVGKDRFKVLLKNLPYDVNWQKLKDICKEVGGEGKKMLLNHVTYNIFRSNVR